MYKVMRASGKAAVVHWIPSSAINSTKRPILPTYGCNEYGCNENRVQDGTSMLSLKQGTRLDAWLGHHCIKRGRGAV